MYQCEIRRQARTTVKHAATPVLTLIADCSVVSGFMAAIWLVLTVF